ncbi:MAG: hypothetical protein ACFCBU_09860 [Cyanophyceae cyanobacterium]
MIIFPVAVHLFRAIGVRLRAGFAEDGEIWAVGGGDRWGRLDQAGAMRPALATMVVHKPEMIQIGLTQNPRALTLNPSPWGKGLQKSVFVCDPLLPGEKGLGDEDITILRKP